MTERGKSKLKKKNKKNRDYNKTNIFLREEIMILIMITILVLLLREILNLNKRIKVMKMKNSKCHKLRTSLKLNKIISIEGFKLHHLQNFGIQQR